MARTTELKCECGEVGLRVAGTPILSTECLCTDCREAGGIFQSLPGAKPVLDEKGATRFVLYRKDRVRCQKGSEALREHRLERESKTRRVIATCCNTPMFLDFSQGHWLSIYGHLWPESDLPPLDLRTMTRDAPSQDALPNDVPNVETHGFRFFAKLIGSWAAMGFRSPKIDYVKGEMHAS